MMHNLDRIDAFVGKMVRRKCRPFPDALASFQKLVDNGWSYTATLGVYVDVVSKGRKDDYVHLDDDRRRAHGVLAVFVFGKAGLRDHLDPIGSLFKRPGSTLYKRKTLNGTVQLLGHRSMVEYIDGLSGHGQAGGGENKKLDCVKGKGKTGSLVFTIDCVPKLLPEATHFCDVKYASEKVNDCGNGAWLLSKRSSDSLLKINKLDSDTAEEIAANRKVYRWLSRQHFIHFTSLHAVSSHVTAMDDNRNVIDTLLVLNRMDGDVSKLRMTIRDIANVAKNTLIVLHIIHDNGHLHLDVKPKNIIYSKPIDGSETKFALADFGILEDMALVYKDLMDSDYSGTYGFMSPLLLDGDDSRNRVYPVFRMVANESSGTSVTDAGLAELFRRERMQLNDKRRLPKIDLHSTGLTLFSLLNNNHDTITVAHRHAMITFIEGLLFFDKEKHYINTFQALRGLCTTFRCCGDIDILSKKS